MAHSEDNHSNEPTPSYKWGVGVMSTSCSTVVVERWYRTKRAAIAHGKPPFLRNPVLVRWHASGERMSLSDRAAEMPTFKCSREEHDGLAAIARRFEVEIKDHRTLTSDGRRYLLMDLTACHCNGMPLDIPKLLAAPTFDLIHDVNGIQRCIDRTTGKLLGCFVPRCAQCVTNRLNTHRR